MSLIKRRPDILLFTPRVISLGQRIQVRTVLECKEAVPIKGATIELNGCGVWYTSSQHGRSRNAAPFVRLVSQFIGSPEELAAGQHDYNVAFDLERGLPATYRGRALRVEWQVRVHVDIPWWPDSRAKYDVHVHGAPPLASAEQGRVFASSSDGPRGREPYAEVALGSERIESGGTLRGTVALCNTSTNNYRSVGISLIAAESLPGLLSPSITHNTVGRWTLDVTGAKENTPIQFSIKLPQGLAPSFQTRKLALKWFVEVRLDVPWARDSKLWIPVDVAAQPLGDQTPARAPLAVGSDRVAIVWGHAASESGFNYNDGELTREVGRCRLVVRREHQGRRGLRLVGEVCFFDADIGLSATAGTLRCNDAAQTKVLQEHMDAATRKLAIAEADDERIACTRDDPGTRIEPVAELAGQLMALGLAFEEARTALPAPQDMAHMVEPFRRAARRLGGDLDLASMDVRGARDEIPFTLETRWGDDGALASTVIRVCPTLPIDGRWHQWWDGEDEPKPMPAGVEVLVDGATSVVVDATAIEIRFPPCTDDLEPHIGRLESLLGVAQRLSGRGAGYR